MSYIDFPYISSSKLEPVLRADITEFPRIEELLTYEEFFTNYLLPNQPCIFSSEVTATWKSRKDWVKDDVPNLHFFKENFGEIMVPVADCGKEQYSSHPKVDMRLSDYINYIWKYRQDGYPEHVRCLYLKDWHFTRDCPQYQAYTTPAFFSSDWLNEFWDTQKQQEDDYRFVYIGPKGSWTPFHADVFRSYSWSANICGRKKWIFFPPGDEEMLKDRYGNLMYSVTDDVDEYKFPNASTARRLEIIQESGEIIFVPSGWHHQVMNLEDTISINHNWLNGCSIKASWTFIKTSLEEVKAEIKDCEDMEEWHQQCQLILKASSGIDYMEFFNFMSTIARNRIEGIGCLNHHKNDVSTEHYKLIDCELQDCIDIKQDSENNQGAERNKVNVCQLHGCIDLKTSVKDNPALEHKQNCEHYEKCHWRYLNIHHALFDLKVIKDILTDMSQDSNFQELSLESLHIEDLLCEIDGFLLKYS